MTTYTDDELKQAIKDDRSKRARKAVAARWANLSPEQRAKQLHKTMEAAMRARGYRKKAGKWVK